MSKISRRDFVNGTLVMAGASILPLASGDWDAMAALEPSYYPPALTGLRGSHPGSNDHAHARAWAGRSDWGPTDKLSEVYDLVVVGAGLSGLAAAYFYQQQHGTNKKILILDNHDDFGGHAKRNEHTIDGVLRLGHGGSQTITDPKYADEIVLDLFADVGVDLKRFDTAYDMGFYERHDLGGATYFNAAVFGKDTVVRHPYCNYPNYVEGLQASKLSNEEAAQQAPLSEAGKEQLLRVLNGGLHSLDVPESEMRTYTRETSYFDYLQNTLGVDDPGVMRMARNSGLDWSSVGTDLLSMAAAESAGAMGFAPKAVYDEDNPYNCHYPDGNAGVARALVKNLVPKVAKGENAEELVLARFNYAELDRADNAVSIRLNSTVVNVEHAGSVKGSSDVLVNYINDNKSQQIKAKNVVMACYNMIIPHIVTGLPEEQSAALKQQNKSPLIYTTVGLRNWRGMQAQGIGMAMCPGNMHQTMYMDFPVSIGGYEYTKTPDDPCVLQMISCPYGEVGAPRLEQYREARYRMLSQQFDDYEQEIRGHLTGMLPGEAFDFDRDVASVSVNRWAHGYTSAGPGDSVQIGRQPFGRITIANSDSAPGADAKTAMMMAHRAVGEINR